MIFVKNYIDGKQSYRYIDGVVNKQEQAKMNKQFEKLMRGGRPAGSSNIYRHRFVCVCPNNKASIIYDLEIYSSRMIHVEKIVIACQLWQEGYHEKIADNLFYQFGERQILRAHHHGVDIETRRGFD